MLEGWKKKTAVKGSQMFIADVVGNVAELVFLRYQHTLDHHLPMLRQGFKQVMYTPMKVAQKPIEFVLDLFPSIEGKEAHDKRMEETEEKRLDGLLEAGYHYTSAIGVGWGSLIVTEKILSRSMGTKELPGKMWTRVDLPVHVGTAALLGTPIASPVTGAFKDFTKKCMTIAGWSEEKAEQDARFVTAYILPNYLTLIPTVGAMGGFYLAEEKGVLRDIGKEKTTWYGVKNHEHHFEMTGKPAADTNMGSIPKGILEVAETLRVIDKHVPTKVTA